MYHGTVGTGTFSKSVKCDNEFKAEFFEGCVTRGCKVDYSLENRPETNARAQAFDDKMEQGTAAIMEIAGAPYHLWAYALKHYSFCKARTLDGRKDGLTPYFRRWRVNHPEVLLPFGCRTTYLLEKEDREKFGRRTAEGIIIGIARLGSYLVLDRDEYLSNKRANVVCTRDVQVHRHQFPLKEAGLSVDDDLEEWSRMFLEYRDLLRGVTTVQNYIDTAGLLQCGQCKKLISNDPITCRVCLSGKGRHKTRGRPNPGCRRSGCAGHEPLDDAIPLIEGDEDRKITLPDGAVVDDDPDAQFEVDGRKMQMTSGRLRMREKGSPRVTPRRLIGVVITVTLGEDTVIDTGIPAANEPSQDNTAARALEPEVSGLLPMLAPAQRVIADSMQTEEQEDYEKISRPRADIYNEMKSTMNDFSEAEQEIMRELRHALGFVMRSINVDSDEAKLPEMKNAIGVEAKQMLDLDVYRLDEVRERGSTEF